MRCAADIWRWLAEGAMVFAMMALTVAAPTAGQSAPDRTEPLPDAFKGVGLNDEVLGNQVPLDIPFRDEDGREVTLQKYFDGEKPVVLMLVYFRCPSICKPVMAESAYAFKGIDDFTAGQDFEVLTVSFDPEETPRQARLTKEQYIGMYDRAGAAKGWHFLTGKQQAIRTLADSVGFRFKQVGDQFSHPPALIILTPEGKVSRFLPGIPDDPSSYPSTVKLSLIEATDGKIGSAIDWFVLTCFHYDGNKGKYTVHARGVMIFAAIVTVLVLTGFLVPAWVRSSRRRAGQADAAEATADAQAPPDADRHTGNNE